MIAENMVVSIPREEETNSLILLDSVPEKKGSKKSAYLWYYEYQKPGHDTKKIKHHSRLWQWIQFAQPYLWSRNEVIHNG